MDDDDDDDCINPNLCFDDEDNSFFGVVITAAASTVQERIPQRVDDRRGKNMFLCVDTQGILSGSTR
jgi:hypothetical protein